MTTSHGQLISHHKAKMRGTPMTVLCKKLKGSTNELLDIFFIEFKNRIIFFHHF